MSGAPKSDPTLLTVVLNIVAGLTFMLAGFIGDQVAFYAVGAVFIVLGAAAWAQRRKGKAEPNDKAGL